MRKALGIYFPSIYICTGRILCFWLPNALFYARLSIYLCPFCSADSASRYAKKNLVSIGRFTSTLKKNVALNHSNLAKPGRAFVIASDFDTGEGARRRSALRPSHEYENKVSLVPALLLPNVSSTPVLDARTRRTRT